MSVNLIPRQIQVIVNGVDRTANFKSFSGGDSRDLSGIVTFSGTIVFKSNGLTLPAWMDVLTETGRAGLERGVNILLYQNGALHPRGRLVVQKTPTPAIYSSVSNGLELSVEVGDRLAAANFRVPIDNVAGGEYGISTGRATIAQRLLLAAKIGTQLSPVTCAIPGSLNYPAIRGTESYISTLGRLALGNGYVVCENHNNPAELEVRPLPGRDPAFDINAPGWVLTPGTDIVELTPNGVIS